MIAFCDHSKSVSRHDPHLLVIDPKVTTHPVLGELDDRGVRFLTLRMGSPRSLGIGRAPTTGPRSTKTPPSN